MRFYIFFVPDNMAATSPRSWNSIVQEDVMDLDVKIDQKCLSDNRPACPRLCHFVLLVHVSPETAADRCSAVDLSSSLTFSFVIKKWWREEAGSARAAAAQVNFLCARRH